MTELFTTNQFALINISNSIDQSEIEEFLKSHSINYRTIQRIPLDSGTHNEHIEITIDDQTLIDSITTLDQKKLPNHPDQIITVFFVNKHDKSLKLPNPKANEPINYLVKYDNSILIDYAKRPGENGILYTNTTFLDKQRSLFDYFIRKIGSNIVQGKSIMNISLPIFIFDTRTLLELWVWQNGYSAIYLEKAGESTDPIQRVKYSSIYALAKLHLTVAQQKPFNPILGETFQCSLLDTQMYLEQTSHHPPRSNFYCIGKHFKIYGFEEPEANCSANSLRICTKGKLTIEYSDGTLHKVIYPSMTLNGLLFGDRSLDFSGKLCVIDEKNNLFAQIDINPDERGMIGKWFKTKTHFPDFIRGVITNIDTNGVYDPKSMSYTLKDMNKNFQAKIEGEFSGQILIDDQIYFDYEESQFPQIMRLSNTLPSDSFYREDMYFLIKGNEDLAGKYKVVMEERQRRDRKLRAEIVNNNK